jgi:hypothetical protein
MKIAALSWAFTGFVMLAAGCIQKNEEAEDKPDASSLPDGGDKDADTPGTDGGDGGSEDGGDLPDADLPDGDLPPDAGEDGGGGLAYYPCPVDKPQQIRGYAINAPQELEADETWTADNVYMVLGKFRTGPYTLTIEPGTVVCFGYEQTAPVYGSPMHGGIEVSSGGAIKALGTTTQHVIFTSIVEAEWWGGVRYKSGFDASSTLKYVDFYKAGASSGGEPIELALSDEDAPLLDVQNVTLHLLQRLGVKVLGKGFTPQSRIHVASYAPYPSDPTYFDDYHVLQMEFFGAVTVTKEMFTLGDDVPDQVRHLRLHQWQIWKDATFRELSMPYQFPDDLAIPGNGGPATLTLEPGVVVQMRDRFQIGNTANALGNLVAVGTAAKPIVFTSVYAAPSTVNGQTPAAGDWNAIMFIPGSFDPAVSKFEHVVFDYGAGTGRDTIYTCQDKTGQAWGAVTYNRSLVGGGYRGAPIKNSTFKNAKFYGVRGYCNYDQDPTKPELSDCLLTNYTEASLNNQFIGFDNDMSNLHMAQTPLSCP